MTFLNPLFLFSLLAVVLPLIVHIFSRRRVPEVSFSTLRFLEGSQRRSMRSVKLRRLLLLILRMIVVALVALAFSRPVIKGKVASLFPGSTPVATCILIDRSYSMGIETEDGPLFKRALETAEKIVGNARDEDMIIISTMDEVTRKIYEGEGKGRFIAGEALGKIGVSWKTTYLRQGVEEAGKMLAKTGYEARELYVISDFQKSSLWKKNDSGGMKQGRKESFDKNGKRRTFIIPVQAEPGGNVAVEDVLCPTVVIHRGEVIELEIVLRNTAKEREAVFRMSVFLDEERIINREITLMPGEKRNEKTAFSVSDTGWVRGEVRLSGDRLAFDDRRFFVLNASEKIKVLLAGGGDRFYLKQAVSPEGSKGDMQLYKPGLTGITSDAVDNADVIVLCPGRALWEEDIEIIKGFIENGGGALIFVRPEHKKAVQEISAFSPGILLRNKELRVFSLRIPLKKPALLSSFSEEEIKGLSRVRFIDDIFVRGIPENAVLLRFKDRSPFIWKESVGKGTVVFFVFEPGLQGGEFVVSPFFLPIVQQAIIDVAGKSKMNNDIRVGRRARWDRYSTGKLNCYFSGIAGRNGENSFDDEEEIGFREKSEGLLIDSVGYPGFISIEDKDGVIGRIAVNPETKGESDLEYMEGREVADSLGLADVAVIRGEGDIERELKTAKEGREIAGFVIFAAIAVFIIEILIAQGIFSKRREEYVG